MMDPLSIGVLAASILAALEPPAGRASRAGRAGLS